MTEWASLFCSWFESIADSLKLNLKFYPLQIGVMLIQKLIPFSVCLCYCTHQSGMQCSYTIVLNTPIVTY